MKIIQINAWLGRLNGPLARFIAEESPDIVCLQEVIIPAHADLPPLHDQYGFLAEIQELGNLPYLSFGPAWAFDVAGARIDEGNAIISKYPLSNIRQVHINNDYHVVKKVSNYIPNTRAFQSATVSLPNGREISIANHQGYLAGPQPNGDNVSVLKMQAVAKELSQLPHPLIFCGDLNVGPKTPTIATLDSLNLKNLTSEADLKTTLSPAHRVPDPVRSTIACDYIFISQEIKVHKFQASDVIVSDHKALILEFEV